MTTIERTTTRARPATRRTTGAVLSVMARAPRMLLVLAMLLLGATAGCGEDTPGTTAGSVRPLACEGYAQLETPDACQSCALDACDEAGTAALGEGWFETAICDDACGSDPAEACAELLACLDESCRSACQK